MNLLYPKISLSLLPKVLAFACVGALVAGTYGMLHDQVTYALAPEYYTTFKFDQFANTDFGLPRRAFASQIGLLATWWVGLIGAWLLARIAYFGLDLAAAKRACYQGLAVMLGSTLIAGVAGFFLGQLHGPDYGHWNELLPTTGVTDVPAFVTVAYIHNAGYIGALLGLLTATVLILAKRRAAKKARL